MSFKRVVLIVALVVLAMPAAALADGITFGFRGNTGATFVVNRPFVVGETASTSGTITLEYLSKMLGTVPFGPAASPTLGVAPLMTWPFMPIIPGNNYGTVALTTGTITSATGVTSATFGAGGSIILTSNSTLATATGGAIPNGTTLFSGSFSGTTTMTQLVLGGITNCDPAVHFCYELAGPISGVLDPTVLSYFGLNPAFANVNGLFLTVNVGFNDTTTTYSNSGQLEAGTASVVQVVPEPGTLALFGTGLIAVAGFIRRRIKA